MEALTSRGIAQRAEGGQGFGRLFTVLLFALFIVALLTWSHISVNTVLLAIYPIVMLFAFSLGVGLILYICLADRQRIGLAAVAAVVVTAGLVTFCTGATAVPAKRKEETVQ